ncbi:MAG: GtrA family protein [Bacteroidales bacterium]|nr:GtrA family protein [Bacteroidales bacterium]
MSKIKNLIITISDWFYKPFRKYIPLELFRYGFTGGLNTLFDIFLYFIFYNFILDKEIVHIGFIAMSPHIAAFVFVFPITFTTGFLLAKYVTFTNSNLSGHNQLIRYGISVTGSIILHYILLKFFVEYVGIWPTFSKIITVAIVSVYSFFVQKFFSFRSKK